MNLLDDLRQAVAHRLHGVQQAVRIAGAGMDGHGQVAAGNLPGDRRRFVGLATELARHAACYQHGGQQAGDQGQRADAQHHQAGLAVGRLGHAGCLVILLFLDGDQGAQQFPPALLHGAEFIAQQLVGIVLFLVQRQRGGPLNEGGRQFALYADLFEQAFFFARGAFPLGEHGPQLLLGGGVFLFLLRDARDLDLDFLLIFEQNQIAQRQRPLGDRQIHALGQAGFDVVDLGGLVHAALDLPHAGQPQRDDQQQEHGDQAKAQAEPLGYG
ncbi:hypothetical protein D3C87_1033570 [compost metagenome]